MSLYTGHRWHPMVLRFALMLHSQSTAAYNTLRNTGVLRLPSESTIRDYTNAIHPKAGFNMEVISEIASSARKLGQNE